MAGLTLKLTPGDAFVVEVPQADGTTVVVRATCTATEHNHVKMAIEAPRDWRIRRKIEGDYTG